MAGQYDGRVVIQTALDNSQIEAGSDELLQAIKSLTISIEALGNKIESWGSNFQRSANQSAAAVSQTTDSLDEAAASADNLRQSAAQAQEAVGSISSERTAEDYYNDNLAMLDKIMAKFETVEDEIEDDPIDVAINIEDPEVSEQSVQAAQEAITEPLEYAAEESTAVSDRIKANMQSCFQAVIQEAREAGDRLKEFLRGGDEQETKALKISTEDPVKEIDALDKELKRLETTARSLSKKDVSKMDSLQLKEYRQQVSETKQKMKELSAEKQRIGQTTYHTKEYKELEADVRKARDRLAELQTRQEALKEDKVDLGSARYKALQREIDRTIKKINDLEATKTILNESGESTVLGADVSGYAQMASRMDALRNKMSGIHPLAIKIKSLVGSALEAVARNAAAAAKNLGKMIGGGIISGVKKLGSALKSAAKHAGGSGGSGTGLAGGLKKIMMYGLGVRSVFALVNKFRSALKEGMGNLAAYSDKFNATMSGYSSAVARLKNSVATAFEPIITAIMPALTALIDGVSAAMTKLSEFFAVLTGQNTYTAAKKYQVDYAKDIAKTTKETDKNTKATKENQRTLAGFDDVEILKENKSDESSDSTIDPSDMFETRAVTNQMKDLLDRLKSMWENADFTALGASLGRKILDALNSIPWDRIKETAAKIGRSFATLLNGIFSVPELFYTIGKTLAEGLNTMFTGLHAFVASLNWQAVGQAFQDGIRGFTDNIDWSLIQDTFEKLGAGLGTAVNTALNNIAVWSGIMTTAANGLNTLVTAITAFLNAVDWYALASNIGIGLNTGIEALDWSALAALIATGITDVALAIDGFVSAVDWGKIGDHFADCVNGIFWHVNWAEIGDALCNSFNAVIDFFFAFVTNLDWGLIGHSIGTAISTAINGIQWFEGGYSIGACIEGLFTTFSALVNAIDWGDLGRAVIDFIAGFFAAFNWGSVSDAISTCLVACHDFFAGALNRVDWESLPKDVIKMISDFLQGYKWADMAESTGKLIGSAFSAIVSLSGSLWKTMLDFGKNIIEGGWEGIKTALKNVGTWIKTNIFDPFTKGFKQAFGIASPSKEMATLGKYIIEGMYNGVVSKLSNVGSWIKTNIFDRFINGFKSIFGIKTSSGSEEMEKEGKHIPAGFETGVKSGMQKVNNNVKQNVVDPHIAAIKRGFGINSSGASELMPVGQATATGLKTGIQNGMSGIQAWIKSVVTDPILNSITGSFGIYGGRSSVMYQYGQAIVTSFTQAFSSNYSQISSWCSNVYQTISNYLGNYHNWFVLGQNITIGLNNGMVAECPTLYNNATKIANNIYRTIQRALDIHSPSKKFKDGIGKNIVLGLAEGLSDYGSEAVAAIDEIADELVREAADLSPALTLEPNLFGMADVLNNVADSFTDGIDTLINALEGIVSSISFSFPDIASGTVVPYASVPSGKSGTGSSISGYSEDSFYSTSQTGITREDLTGSIDRIVQAIYENRTQIGAEDLARACQTGMERLSRRFNKNK